MPSTQIVDLPLDAPDHDIAVTETLNAMLAGHTCSVCGAEFEDQEQRDNAIVSGEHPTRFAHESCWRRETTHVDREAIEDWRKEEDRRRDQEK